MDDWNDSESAKFVLEWAEKKYINAVLALTKANAEEVGRIARQKYWNEQNPEDGVGGFSQNPYERDKKNNLRIIERASEDSMILKKVLDFVRNRICNLIEDEIQGVV